MSIKGLTKYSYGYAPPGAKTYEEEYPDPNGEYFKVVEVEEFFSKLRAEIAAVTERVVSAFTFETPLKELSDIVRELNRLSSE